MLKHLYIKSYALIDELDIELHPGFSTLTGETGAGKSIILGALSLLLGGRADSKAIKAGEKKCTVEATFDITGLNLNDFFEQEELDNESDECIIRREVLASGKSRSFINDTPVSLQQLKALTSQLIDIHSQHKNLLLNQEHFLIDTLDGVAANAHIRTEYQSLYDQYRALRQEKEELEQQIQSAKAEEDYLTFQATQLNEANLTETEQDELENELNTLSHAEEIKNALFQTSDLLQEGENNLLGQLRTCIQLLHGQAEVFNKAKELSDRLDSSYIELNDIADDISRYAEEVEFNPERLTFVNDRLNLIYTLEQKHHVSTVAELIALQEDINRRLQSLNTSDERLRELDDALNGCTKQLHKTAATLSESRQEAAKHLTENLKERLTDLGMPHTELEFAFIPKSPTPSGTDGVSLLFSANRNVPKQDVSHIASGGEIARLMLALKAATTHYAPLPTIIFDEIDTGVSGRIAEKMALTMKEMSTNGQIISITHLPQIAARGDYQYRVFKQEEKQGTVSHIAKLSDAERIEEIAHMLSGETLTDAAIHNAQSLLDSSHT